MGWSKGPSLAAVMYNTGARVSEAIGLRHDDLLNVNARTLRIRKAAERVVPSGSRRP